MTDDESQTTPETTEDDQSSAEAVPATKSAPVDRESAGPFDEAHAACRDDDGPAVTHALDDVLEGTLGVPAEARHDGGVDPHVVTGRRDGLVVGQDLARVEAAHREPRPVAGGVTQVAQGEEVARIEVDRRLGARGGGVPGRGQELTVGLGQALGP